MIPVIRKMKYSDLTSCANIVGKEWGPAAEERAHFQMLETFTLRPADAPTFFVATHDFSARVIGFAGIKQSTLMNGFYDVIWIGIEDQHRKFGIGRALMTHCIEAVDRYGGSMLSGMTQKPEFFQKLGFYPLKHFNDGWTIVMRPFREVGL